jgi:hypothetical protein
MECVLQRSIYDVNANSNLRPSIAAELGFDPFERVVDFLVARLRQTRAAARDAARCSIHATPVSFRSGIAAHHAFVFIRSVVQWSHPARALATMPHSEPHDSGLTHPGQASRPAPGWLATEALSLAELRRAEADEIAWELSSRQDLDDVPEAVQDFLFGPWTRVLAHIRSLRPPGDTAPHRYERAIDDLIWSVKPDALRHPAEVLQRVPPLVASLRQGLALLGEEAHAHESFFDALMKLHRPVLHVRRARSRRAGESTWSGVSGPVPLTSLAHEDDEDTGFEPTLVWQREPASAAEGAPPSTGALSSEALRLRDRMRLWSGERWLPVELKWVSANASLFLFVSERGRQHSMTRRTCNRLLREALLVPLVARD